MGTHPFNGCSQALETDSEVGVAEDSIYDDLIPWIDDDVDDDYISDDDDRTGICICTDIAISAYYFFCILKYYAPFSAFTADILLALDL